MISKTQRLLFLCDSDEMGDIVHCDIAIRFLDWSLEKALTDTIYFLGSVSKVEGMECLGKRRSDTEPQCSSRINV
jgi:hypothetical protein